MTATDCLTSCELPVHKTGLKVTTPEDAHAQLLEYMSIIIASKRECVFALFMDERRRTIGKPYCVGIGILGACLVHPRELFREAILRSAASLVVAHNHPSGDCEPSAEDYQLTRRLIDSGELLGIEVSDHLILGKGTNFLSLRNSGIRWVRRA